MKRKHENLAKICINIGEDVRKGIFFAKSFMLLISVLPRVKKGILGLLIDKTWYVNCFVGP